MPARAKQNYNGPHKRLRDAWQPHVAQGIIRCWRCGQRITTNDEWDLGHRTNLPPHPEHRACNRSAGAAEGNRRREPRTAIW